MNGVTAKLNEVREKLKEDKAKEAELAQQLERRRKTQSALMLNDLHIAVQTLIDRNHIPVHRENSYPANRLNHCVERILVFGLKKSWLGFKHSFFEFITAGALESIHARLKHDANLAKSIQDLNADAKGRAFLRQALNEKHLAEYISRLTIDPNILKVWYHPWSLIGNSRQLETFKATLEDLDLVKSDFNLLLNDKKLNILQLWEFDSDDVPQWQDDAERGIRKATLAACNPDEEVVQSLPKKKKKKKKRKREKLDIVASDDPSLYENKLETPDQMNQEKSVDDLLRVTDIETLKELPKPKEAPKPKNVPEVKEDPVPTKVEAPKEVHEIPDEQPSEPIPAEPHQISVQAKEDVHVDVQEVVDNVSIGGGDAIDTSDSASDKVYSEDEDKLVEKPPSTFAMADLFANDEVEKTSYLAPLQSSGTKQDALKEPIKEEVSSVHEPAAVQDSAPDNLEPEVAPAIISPSNAKQADEPTKQNAEELNGDMQEEEVDSAKPPYHEQIIQDYGLNHSLSEDEQMVLTDGRERFDTASLEQIDWNTYEAYETESEEEVDSAPEPVENVFPGSQVKHRLQSQSFSTVIEWTLIPLPKRKNVRIMKAQNGMCATCGDKLQHNFLRRPLFHYCRYTGKFHCLKCHKKDMQVIPSRVIHKADTRKTKVSRAAYFYLKQMYSMHCISLSSFTRETLESRPVLKEFVMVVKKLVKVNHFIQTCRYKSKLLQLIGKYRYLLSSHELVSLEDVVAAIDGTLVKDLREVLVQLEDHVRNRCELCTVRGHICEICQSEEIIFSFDFENVIQCSLCGGVFHKHCFKPMQCPRCARRSRRSISSTQGMGLFRTC